MRQARPTLVVMIALGGLGAWMGVCAQERRTPWPHSGNVLSVALPLSSSPVLAQTAQRSGGAGDRGSKGDEQPPPTIEVSAIVGAETAPPKMPSKVPAEVPARGNKLEFEPPELLPRPTRKMPPAEPLRPAFPDVADPPPPPLPKPSAEVPAPKSIEASRTADPPSLPKPSAESVVPKSVEAPRAPEPPPLPTPGATTAAPLPIAAPRVPDPPPLPVFVEPKPAEMAPKLPAVESPSVENLTGSKQAPPPAGSVSTKPIEPMREAVVPVLPSSRQGSVVAVPPAPVATPPIDVQAPPARPPAFLLVKPRRVEAAPAPMTPAPALIDQPRAPAVPLASSSAHVTVEKRGPAMVRQGDSASYEIIVRNRGAVASGPVTVVAEIPRAARLVTGDPAPANAGDKAIWTLAPLPANSETLLRLDLMAVGSGEMVGNTTVYVASGTATTRTTLQAEPSAGRVVAGPLEIQLRGPAGGAVGQPVVFEVTIANHSKRVLSELVLHAKLDAGLTHPAGDQIEADVGELAPGARKTFKIPTTALREGRHTLEVKITAAGGAEAKTQTTVPINGSGLSLQLGPTTRLQLNREGDLRIDVTNHQSESLRNVVVADMLPEQVQFLGASDRGIYQASTRTVQWLLDVLPPGETRSVVVRVQGKAPGQFAHEVSARAEALPPTTAQTMIQVDNQGELVLKVTPRDQTLDVGRETICEVRIQNLGAQAATGLRLQVELPPGLSPGHVQGPTGQRTQGGTMVFEPIAKLPVGMQAVYHVGVSARLGGEWRLRTQVVSDQAATPIVRETSLQAFAR